LSRAHSHLARRRWACRAGVQDRPILDSCRIMPSRGRGQLGAPGGEAAARRSRGRTRLTPTSGGTRCGGEEGSCRGGLWGRRDGGCGGSSGRGVCRRWSRTHPFGVVVRFLSLPHWSMTSVPIISSVSVNHSRCTSIKSATACPSPRWARSAVIWARIRSPRAVRGPGRGLPVGCGARRGQLGAPAGGAACGGAEDERG